MRSRCLGTGFEQTPETLGNIKSKIAALDKDALGGVWVFRTVCFERVVLSSPGCLWPDRMDDRSINQRNGTSVIAIASTAITLALVFYTIGVFNEHRAGTLNLSHIIFFYMGLVFDTAGTAAMSVIARGNSANLAHATTGLLASRHLPVRVSQSIDR